MKGLTYSIVGSLQACILIQLHASCREEVTTYWNSTRLFTTMKEFKLSKGM
jgi:hypothetical protein